MDLVIECAKYSRDVYSTFRNVDAVYNDGVTFIVFRGTSDFRDMLTDAHVTMKPLDCCNASLGDGCSGFVNRALMCMHFVMRVIETSCRVVMTGHSLGGSVAQATMLMLPPPYQASVEAVITFAPTLVVNKDAFLNATSVEHKIHNYVNKPDIVPRLYTLLSELVPVGSFYVIERNVTEVEKVDPNVYLYEDRERLFEGDLFSDELLKNHSIIEYIAILEDVNELSRR